ncbi:hypothetical protein [Neisseria weixii]|nr:hypothetical protein [Neisseria weixii]
MLKLKIMIMPSERRKFFSDGIDLIGLIQAAFISSGRLKSKDFRRPDNPL